MFRNRNDAGERLAAALGSLHEDALVLGIPRGGVVVARAVADALGLELEVIITRKLGAPSQPELAVGAVGPDGNMILDERVLASVEVPTRYIERERLAQMREIERRSNEYRGSRAPLSVAGRHCVVVDDGIATGSTARAALAWLKSARAKGVILAVPVAPRGAVRALAKDADEVVALETPEDFFAVGQFYEDFSEVVDEEVVEALGARHSR